MSSVINEHTLIKNGIVSAFLLVSLLGSLAIAGDWSLKDNNGVKYNLADQKGKWVLVNFWAPWCPTCVAELPELISLQTQHKDVLVIGVAVLYRNKKEVMDIVQAKSISYPVVMGNEDIASEFGEMEGMPTSFLYSPTGKLIGHHDGPMTQIEIEQAFQQKPDSAGLFVN